MSEFPLSRDSYLAFDALTIKQHIQNALNKGGVFTDQNYEGSYITTVIDIISYTFHVLMFYLNNTSTESMFSEAQIYENMNRIVKMLDYKPQGIQTSILPFKLQAEASLNTGSYTIPRYSYISAKGIPYCFTEDITITKNTPNTELLQTISDKKLLYQGIYREYPLYTAVGDSNEVIYLLPGVNVLINHNTIDVYVKSARTQKWEQWDSTPSLYFENAFSKKYEIRLNEKKNYEIKFGNDINGVALQANDVVAIYYMESQGSNGTVGIGAINNQKMRRLQTTQFDQIIADITNISEINYMSNQEMINLSFSNNDISTYTSLAETTDDIRNNAPATFRSQFRLVTINDHNNYIKSNFAQLVHDVETINNWGYVSQYLKYFYDIGLTNPSNISRVLFNQLNYADACNFNNVYLVVVPKTYSTTGLSYITPANKQMIIETINETKTLTSEIIIIDPVYISYAICAPRTSDYSEINLQDIENTKLVIVKNSSSRKDDFSIISDVTDIFTDYFNKENCSLGQIVDLNQLISDILSIDDIDSVYTENTTTGEIFAGLSLLQWNPIYSEVSSKLVFNSQRLSKFMFPILDDVNLKTKISVTSTNKIYENIEY